MSFLTSRQSTILNRTVDVHIERAQPVGSRLLTEVCGDLDFSPATIRNEMGHLEEMGFLTQPHISSGRVPTDSGYRYYLNHSIFKEPPCEADFELDAPADLIPLGEGAAEALVQHLSSSVREASLVLLTENLPSGAKRHRLFLQGSAYFLEKPEFQDVQKLRPVFSAFEEKNRLIGALLEQAGSPEVRVSVGHENGLEGFHECSVVSGGYCAGHSFSGLVAVIGPRRMHYSRIIATVRQMSALMAGFFFESEEADTHESGR